LLIENPKSRNCTPLPGISGTTFGNSISSLSAMESHLVILGLWISRYWRWMSIV
jgi:hypothetical protein